jgi:O-acetyl-ADP-ribose deacetylase
MIMESDESKVPTAEQIDALLAFLPIFERQGYVAAKWVAEPGCFPYWIDSLETGEFRSTIYSSGFFCPFGWVSWQEEAKRYVNEPERLGEADRLTIRRLLTLHSRKDRFMEGHFAGMIECGHVVGVLRRFGELKAILHEAS